MFFAEEADDLDVLESVGRNATWCWSETLYSVEATLAIFAYIDDVHVATGPVEDHCSRS